MSNKVNLFTCDDANFVVSTSYVMRPINKNLVWIAGNENKTRENEALMFLEMMH